MGFIQRFIPHSMLLNASWINQIQSTTPNAGIALFEETSGSEVDRQFVAAREIDPMIAVVSTDLTALATVGFSGYLAGTGTGPAVIYGRLLPLGALPTAIASSAHLTLSVSDGLIVPKSVSASQNQAARLGLELHAILGSTSMYSGATPFVWASGQTITSGAGATANIYTVGSVKFTVSGGSSYLVSGLFSQSVDFGIQLLKDTTDGQVYAQYVSIIGRNARFEFSTKDLTQLPTIGDGVSCSAFATYFQQVAQNGQRVAPATATHIKISATAGMLTPGTTNLVHKQGGGVGYTFTPTLNTAQIVISTTSAIPTS